MSTNPIPYLHAEPRPARKHMDADIPAGVMLIRASGPWDLPLDGPLEFELSLADAIALRDSLTAAIEAASPKAARTKNLCCYLDGLGVRCAAENEFGGFCSAHDEEIHQAGGGNWSAWDADRKNLRYTWAARGPWWMRWGAVWFAWAVGRQLRRRP